jgi:anti-sigma regulatory factor (Ser/Thr protein kinase)
MDDFRHEALFYEGADGFFDHVLPFLRAGAAAGEPTLVVVSAERIRALRAALGADGNGVQFADMDVVGRNPARMIPAWQRFVDAHSDTVRPLRGVGEPVVASRRPAELEECAIHEALLNVAFTDSRPWWLVCPYDVATLDNVTLEHARDNHPFCWHDGRHTPEAADHDHAHAHAHAHAAFAWPDASTLPEPTTVEHTIAFDHGSSLEDLRDAVGTTATRAGFDVATCEELALAVHEMSTNSIRHGGGRGILRTWLEGDAVVCEVRDGGRIGDPLAGRRQPPTTRLGGRGLWIANQLCDLVQIRRAPAGLVVRAHLRRRDSSQLRTSNVSTPR